MSKQHLDKPAVINGVYLFGERHATRWKGCEGQRSHADMRPQPALVRPLGRGVGKVTVLVVRQVSTCLCSIARLIAAKSACGCEVATLIAIF